MTDIDNSLQNDMRYSPSLYNGGVSGALSLPKQKIKMPSISLFGEGGRRHSIPSESKERMLRIYNEEKLGLQYNKDINNDYKYGYAGYAVLGLEISTKKDTGFYLDTSVGLKGNLTQANDPTYATGGGCLNAEIGYKYPIGDQEGKITFDWDSYANFAGSYKTAGKHNYISEQLRDRGINHSQIENFVINGLTLDLQKEYGYDYNIGNPKIKYDNLKMDVSSFSGKTVKSYSESDNNLQEANINAWELKSGVGTGIRLNNNLNSGNGKMSIYAGIEAGYHKMGPNYTITAENLTYTDDTEVTDLGSVTYTSNRYKNAWYVTPKVGFTYTQEGNFLRTSLIADLHEILFSVRMNFFQKELK